MTINTESSAPLVVVVGCTGKQGGSVVNNLDESDKAYRIRGLTRNPNQPAAQALADRGVEVLGCDISVGHEVEVEKAFSGGSFVFVVTNYWEHCNKSREIAEGKLMINAAKRAGAKLLILSSEPSVTKLSNGRLDKVSHFDSKGEISEYAASVDIPYVEVHVGGYMDNLMTTAKPRPTGPDSYKLVGTWRPECKLPLIDTLYDAGLFVRLAIESDEFNKGTGKIIAAYSEWVSIADQAKILCEQSGKTVEYVQLSDEQFATELRAAGLPEHVVDDMLQMFRFHDEYWEQTYIDSNRTNLARKPRTFREWCQSIDIGKIFSD